MASTYNLTAATGNSWFWLAVGVGYKANSGGSGDTTPPTVPTNLSATAISSSAINLSWTASTDNVGVTGYTIYRNGSQIATSATNSYSDSGLSASTQYTYTVDAYDAAGNHSSQSSSASATTQSSGSGSYGTYTTNFPLTENPISENGNWINGAATGLEWQNVQTTSGFAFGTQSGNAGGYDDSTAVVSGSWGSNQTAQATADCPTHSGGQELELRLRTSITPNSITGYELNFSCGSEQYNQIVRWNGPLNNFTQLSAGTATTISTGDVVKATIVGSTITVYINNVQVDQTTDSTYSSGSPGIGFWRDGGGSNANFGFSSFSATDGSGSDTTPPSVPTNLSATAISSSAINLSWTASTDNVGVTGYKVYRGGVQIGTSATNSYSDTGLTASTQYTYTVSAYDAAGNNSSQSTSASATTQASSSDTTPPSTPTNLSATAISSSAINLSWTASTDNVGVTGYKIYRGGVQIGTSATNSYSDTGLTASTQYTYTVSAYDAAGNNSSQSTSASATTQAASSGANIYLAQSAAGTGDGSSCANAKVYTFFNTSANWALPPLPVKSLREPRCMFVGRLVLPPAPRPLLSRAAGRAGTRLL